MITPIISRHSSRPNHRVVFTYRLPSVLKRTVLLGAALALGACCHFEPPAASDAARQPAPASAHIVRVDRNGVLLDLEGTPQTGDNALAYLNQKVLTPLDAALASGRYPEGVLIFVHGGLNSAESARKHFESSHVAIMRDGYYPIFLLWPSDLLATWGEHLARIRQGVRESGRLGSTFAALTSPLVLVQDVTSGLARTPMVIMQSLRTDLETSLPVAKRNSDPVRNYRMLASHHAHGDLRPLWIDGDYKTVAESSGRFVSYFATLPAKLATGGPIIDTFGRPAWDNMLRRTYMVYPGHLNFRTHDPEIATPQQSGGGTTERREARQLQVTASGFGLLVRELESRQSAGEAKPPKFRLTLAGHSMGTIVLNHVLDETTLVANRIIYLAAACSVRDYAASVLPYLKRNQGTVSYNLMLHPESEIGEMQTKLADLPPRGSLLVWIDNFLSNPVSEQDRTAGRWTNLFLEAPSGLTAMQGLLEHPVNKPKFRMFFYAFSAGCGTAPRGAIFQWQDITQHPLPERPADVGAAAPHTHANMASIHYWKPHTWIGPDLSQ